MKFRRAELNDSVKSLIDAPDDEDRCVGQNYLIEENVSDRRLDDVEGFLPNSKDVRTVVEHYFDASVEGSTRSHRSSTFDDDVNGLALLPNNLEPTQKIIRVERVDRHIAPTGELKFDELISSLKDRDQKRLSDLTNRMLNYPGSRPWFATLKEDVADDLSKKDWLQIIIDRLGLFHHYPYVSSPTPIFALMEYSAAEVIEQGNAQGIRRCFAIPTVLESQDSPAFMPVPNKTAHGRTVDLRERFPHQPSAREILHIRFEYSWDHVKRIKKWPGAETPEIMSARSRHLPLLRTETGRDDFGKIRQGSPS